MELQNKARAFWDAVAAQKHVLAKSKASGESDRLQGAENALPFGVWLITVAGGWANPEQRGGAVCCANLDIAARKLIEGSHRLAVESEIRAFLENSKREYSKLKAIDDAREGRRTITIEALPAEATTK
jgi:hypothetical protein